MNLQLSDTEEYIAGKETGGLGMVLIRYAPHIGGLLIELGRRGWRRLTRMRRCNNVLWISAAKDDGGRANGKTNGEMDTS